ncbi:polysaccharide biosynthesis C-terminal domain-containing protein [Proteiniborus sp. MB09-C3]|uniref:lipopolysaccharide biosynthesis protein n=1 Tax=Proteiniborus sp. MB09-C3 TaxID=3050072 RepID=UPI002554F27C|nr:polysaccharide biosynthesis C-terminal domain-containing protein [Proteiniborus sp. MB09-C3]WIV12966.1 polysaccharide biosynthesis C-terminal domain-containing protein [Proteiniborus sp. MB09-C3]
MDRYKKLASNTFTFAIGTFSSKLLVFLMLPLYTRVLTSAEYGEVDLIVQTCNVLVPIVSAGILNAVIRFGLDSAVNKKSVFSIGLLTILLGFIGLCILEPVLLHIEFISQYTRYIYFFILMSNLHSLCSNFVRSQEYVKLYAFDGVFRTVLTVILNIVFLVIFRYGISGYLLATILSDFISTIMLFFAAKLYRFISLGYIDKSLFSSMMRYSLPLIPTTVSTWIINMSDRYVLSYMLGSEANGLYAIAYKVPTIITIVTGIFMDAWQISAVNEHQKGDGGRFFSKVLDVYSSLVFCGASVIIALTKMITKILTSPEFFSSWIYIPVLVMGTIFACLASFLGSAYMAQKKSEQILITTMISAVLNIILNFILIPAYGIQGAAIATLLSYICMLVIRAVNIRRFMNISWNIPKLIINMSVIMTQSVIILLQIENWFIYEVGLILIIALVNVKALLMGARRIIE